MNLYWDWDSSTLYENLGTIEVPLPGRMLGWAQRFGDRHKEIGWHAFVVGLGMLPANARIVPYRLDPHWQSWFPDECMAKQAVLDTVRKEQK